MTFYSFKGGVGRTLALVNVAVHLATRGKNVLLVDFDLEAPGLDAFPALNVNQDVPGIVEFVADYIRTGVAPDVSSYIAQCNLKGLESGRLAVMRSGLRKRDYSARLSGIDWQKLYSEQDGYLLLEDLKAQWQRHVGPDYVLVDSRTGHTDVGGICTRQLPNAVVVCFLPNEENISGLETVAADIRDEGGPNGRSIDLQFVVSNVPYLDDENRILDRRLKEAKARLHFQRPAAIVHRYESLTLLNNEIFVQRRRGTRLAKEYRELAMAITSRNFEDRDVSLRLLHHSTELPSFLQTGDRSLSGTMERIQVLHSNDGEVLYSLSRVSERLGKEAEARSLLERAKALGFRSPATVLDTALDHIHAGELQNALANIEEAENHHAADYFTLSRAVGLGLKMQPSALGMITQSAAFQKLPPPQQATLCEEMLVRRDCLPIAEEILRSIIESADPRAPFHDLLRISMMLCLIGQGKFEQATLAMGKHRPNAASLDMIDAFNYAIAEWGMTHRPPTDLFQRVLEFARDLGRGDSGKNVLQCVSLSAWAVGNTEMAIEFWKKADALAAQDSADTFSGWRYLRVSPAQFRSDLEELGAMLSRDAVAPEVLREHWKGDAADAPVH